MKIFNNINEFHPTGNTVATIGTFDGVHCGHRKIINLLTTEAKTKELESVLITFQPHPQIVLCPENYEIKLINSIDEKISLLEKTGIDNLLMIPFTKEFARIDAETFVKEYILSVVKASELIVGYDHHFGKDRSGKFTTLVGWGDKYGFTNKYVDPVIIDGVIVSSTKIRTSISEGNIKRANKLLGYDFYLEGKVIEGNKIGRKIGYPTANIETGNINKIIPADGIYVVKVMVNQSDYFGMCNIGLRPTFNFTNRTIEVNIFDVEKDIYGSEIKVSFIDRLRDEMKFDNIELLIKQIDKDKLLSLEIISKLK